MEEQQLAEAVDCALGQGAAEAEVVLSISRSLDIEVSKGEVETLSSATARGLGVRLFTPEKRMGFAFTASADEPIETTVQRALENAAANDPEPHAGISNDAGALDTDWSEQDPASIPVEKKIAFAKDLEQVTLQQDSRIEQVEQAAYGDSLVDFALVNSAGVRRRYRNAHFSCAVTVVAAQSGADSELGWEFDFAGTFDRLRPEWVAQTCAHAATRRLGGRPCASGILAAVLDYSVATQFLQVLSGAFCADNILKGKSFLAGKTGEYVASEHMSIVDDNACPGAMNRAPFDGEGTPAQTTRLVGSGRLEGCLHNLQTASEMGGQTTANAARGYSSPPDVGPSNLFIVPGETSQEALFRIAGNGIFITDAMGVHTADPISGDFSFGASGLLIEQGELGRPVRGITVAGNIQPLLKAVAAVGDDLRFLGACGAPSLCISEIVVSGE